MVTILVDVLEMKVGINFQSYFYRMRKSHKVLRLVKNEETEAYYRELARVCVL